MKKKKQLNRKQRALRWIGVLLILFVLNQALGLCCLTPQRAIRRYEQEYLWPEGEVLLELESEERGRTYLVEHGDALYGDTLCVGKCIFVWMRQQRGWQYEPMSLTMRETEGAPVWGQIHSYRSGESEADIGSNQHIYFGYVRDPDIVKVEALLRDTETKREWTQQVSAADFIKTERGHTVFLMEMETEFAAGRFSTVTGIYADGTRTEPMNVIWNYGFK